MVSENVTSQPFSNPARPFIVGDFSEIVGSTGLAGELLLDGGTIEFNRERGRLQGVP